MRYAHTSIHVRDLAASITFYQSVVGLEILRRMSVGSSEIVFLANAKGETCLELLSIPSTPCFEGKGLSIGFATDDVTRDHLAAQERGLHPSELHRPNPNTTFFFVQDPDGLAVQLIQED